MGTYSLFDTEVKRLPGARLRGRARGRRGDLTVRSGNPARFQAPRASRRPRESRGRRRGATGFRPDAPQGLARQRRADQEERDDEDALRRPRRRRARRDAAPGTTVTRAATATKPTRNHGSFTAGFRALARAARARPADDERDRHDPERRARASRSWPPRRPSARTRSPRPTTELVSWIASAANRPNPSSSSPARCPSGGNTTSATALRRKTVASATEMDSDLA